VSTPHRGNGNDLSCSVQAADGGVSNVRSINDVLSVSTNISDESVLRSATVPSSHRGKEGGQSHIINLVAECVPGCFPPVSKISDAQAFSASFVHTDPFLLRLRVVYCPSKI